MIPATLEEELVIGSAVAEELREQLKIRNEPQIATELVERILNCFTRALALLTQKQEPYIVENWMTGASRSISPEDSMLDEIEKINLEPKLCRQDQLYSWTDSTFDLSEPVFLEVYVNLNSPRILWPKQIRQMNTARNFLSLDNNESVVGIGIDGKMPSYVYGDSNRCNTQNQETKQRGPMLQLDDTFNQHKRKETIKSVSSYVATLSFIFLVLSSNYSHSLLSKKAPQSFWHVIIDFLIFILFFWAVILWFMVRAQFTRVQSAMLLFWALFCISNQLVQSPHCTFPSWEYFGRVVCSNKSQHTAK